MNIQGRKPYDAAYGGPDYITIDNCTFDDNGGRTFSGNDDIEETLNFGYAVIRATVSDCIPRSRV